MSFWNIFNKPKSACVKDTAPAIEENSKLLYLRKYNKKVSLIETADLPAHIAHIPTPWQAILTEKDQSIKIGKVLTLWNAIIGTELRNVIAYLQSNLQSIDLLFDGKQYSVLYGIASPKGTVLYYEGKLSIDDTQNIALKSSWANVPTVLQRFYEQLHNGFYYYASYSMGLSPYEDVAHLGEYDWSILEELHAPLCIDLEKSFGFFTNGMGAFVVVDTTTKNPETATLWFKNKAPKYDVSFWDITDEWIVIGFTQ